MNLLSRYGKQIFHRYDIPLYFFGHYCSASTKWARVLQGLNHCLLRLLLGQRHHALLGRLESTHDAVDFLGHCRDSDSRRACLVWQAHEGVALSLRLCLELHQAYFSAGCVLLSALNGRARES